MPREETAKPVINEQRDNEVVSAAQNDFDET